MDVDGLVGQGRNLLFLEQKGLDIGYRLNGRFVDELIHKPIPLSFPLKQNIKRAAASGHSFITFWGDRPDGQDTQFLQVCGIPGFEEYQDHPLPATLADFRKACSKWWELNWHPRSNFGPDLPPINIAAQAAERR